VNPQALEQGLVTGLALPDALIFDLDGTCWDAAEPTLAGWNNALRSWELATRSLSRGSASGRDSVRGAWSLVPSSPPPRKRRCVL